MHVSNTVCDKNERTKNRTENSPEMQSCFLRQEKWAQWHGRDATYSSECTGLRPQKGETNAQWDLAQSLFLLPLAREARVRRSPPTRVKRGGIPSPNGANETPKRARQPPARGGFSSPIYTPTLGAGDRVKLSGHKCAKWPQIGLNICINIRVVSIQKE